MRQATVHPKPGPGGGSEAERLAAHRFLDLPGEDSFTTLYRVLAPNLVRYFQVRTSGRTAAEDLAQEVMLTLYLKGSQIRNRALFHGWLFQVARNALRKHYASQARLASVDLDQVSSTLAEPKPAATEPFEFETWMSHLNEVERDVIRLRFVQGWEYHEIAAARAVPVGTVQWRAFRAKKKLAAHLTRPRKCASPPD
jgi:RNA polymerase sigma factor (sigma-70 family)